MEIIRYQAAGGIVVDGERLLLLRKPALSETVLPKGHIEEGETPEQAAVRETIEETGYSNLEVIADLGLLQAQYPRAGAWYIREERYFLMALRGPERVEGLDYDDAAEDQATFEKLWVPLAEAESRMSFEPARSFVSRAVKKWRELNR